MFKVEAIPDSYDQRVVDVDTGVYLEWLVTGSRYTTEVFSLVHPGGMIPYNLPGVWRRPRHRPAVPGLQIHHLWQCMAGTAANQAPRQLHLHGRRGEGFLDDGRCRGPGCFRIGVQRTGSPGPAIHASCTQRHDSHPGRLRLPAVVWIAPVSRASSEPA